MTIAISAIEELLPRINASLAFDRGNIIGFIASGKGEGNSSVARAYTIALADRLKRKVLLLETGGTFHTSHGVMQALAANQPIDRLLRTMAGGAKVGLLGFPDADSGLWGLVTRNELWKELRLRFDHVVLDLPSADVSRLGLTVAPHCDGVVVLLEAEKSRAPVVASLIGKLRGVRANIVGAVLNKRRYHVPGWLYRWL